LVEKSVTYFLNGPLVQLNLGLGTDWFGYQVTCPELTTLQLTYTV